MQLAWNTTETHREVLRFFFASALPSADGERGRFSEAEVENEKLETAGDGWVHQQTKLDGKVQNLNGMSNTMMWLTVSGPVGCELGEIVACEIVLTQCAP